MTLIEPPLHLQHCHDSSAAQLFTEAERNNYLKEIPQWAYSVEKQKISRQFTFKNYYETLAFINAVAWIAHRENHHPDIEFGYNRCTINFSTHTVGGITLFDVICAAHIEQL